MSTPGKIRENLREDLLRISRDSPDFKEIWVGQTRTWEGEGGRYRSVKGTTFWIPGREGERERERDRETERDRERGEWKRRESEEEIERRERGAKR
eukprot:1330419-Amorphochlora_amoeboformis.AAC.1